MADKKVTVKSGQTLSAIAKANKTTVAAIKAANPKLTTDPKYKGGSTIFSGTKLTIPGASATKKPTTVGGSFDPGRFRMADEASMAKVPATITKPTVTSTSTTTTSPSTSFAFPTTTQYDPGYGSNPVTAAGVSSTYATGRDTLSMAQLQAQFGIAAAVLANNPGLVEA